MPKAAPKTSRREARIDAITRAAQAVFLEVGYDSANLDEIARRANASKATIYAHFGNKLGLFKAIMEGVIAQAQMPLQQSADAPVPDVLTRFGTGFLTLMLSPAPLAFYRLMVSTGAQIPDVTEMWFENGPKRMIAGVAAFIAARSRTGELDVPDPIAAAELFLMSMRGVVHLQAVTGLIKPPFDAAIAAKVKAAVDMFMRAYGRKPPVRAPRRPRP